MESQATLCYRTWELGKSSSQAVVRQIQIATAQSNLKSIMFNLGGKPPVIISPNAYIDKTVENCCHFFLKLNGQGCICGTGLWSDRVCPNEEHWKSASDEPST
jgi:hypothetical protein